MRTSVFLSVLMLGMAVGPGGYAGLAPLGGAGVGMGGGRVAVAAALRPAAVARVGPRGASAELLAPAGLAEDDLDALPARGAPPLSRRRESVEAGGRVFVAGDAASYVEPFTGEGMSWALEDAEAVAAIAARVVAGDYREGEWTAQRARMARARGRTCRAVAAVLARGVPRRAAFGLARTAPGLAEALASRLLGGRAGPRSAAGSPA